MDATEHMRNANHYPGKHADRLVFVSFEIAGLDRNYAGLVHELSEMASDI